MAESVTLLVPAKPEYARTVRMTAANLAVVMNLDVDTVEDVRIAAEEGFVYACATRPEACGLHFELGGGEVRMGFTLGTADPEETEGDLDLDLVETLLAAVCDDFGVSEDGRELSLVKKVIAHVA